MVEFHYPNRIAAVLIALLLITSWPVAAQDLPRELQGAATALERNQPVEALAVAQAYLRANPRDRHVLAATLIAGRAELALDRVDSAVRRGQDILALADEDSPYRADAHYLLATSYQAAGDHAEAARELIRTLDTEPAGNLSDMALRRLGELMRGPAAYAANDVLRSARTESTRRAVSRLLPTSATTPTIGLLLPDTESDWEFSETLRAGVEAALDIWRADGGSRVVLKEAVLPDEPARSATAARDLVRRDGCWAIIAAGPEEFVVPAVVEAQAAGVPVILPGQGRPSLRGLGPGVVLPVIDWREEGRLAAMYAADVLLLRTFGIVAPYTEQGREHVAGFLEVLEERDEIEILDQEWYRPEEGVSLAGQFRDLRTIGFKREFREQLIEEELLRQDSLWAVADSLGLVRQFEGQLLFPDTLDGHRLIWPLVRDSIRITDEQLEREWRRNLLEVRQSAEFKAGNIDSNAISLRTYEALYLPIEPGTIPIFAPQFAFYSFEALRIGNSAWHDPIDLLRHREYVEDLAITAHAHLDDTGEAIWRLSHELGDSVDVPLEAWHVFGHDAVRLLLIGMTGHALDQPGARVAEITHTGPDALSTSLRSLRRASLAAGRQVFGPRGPVGQGAWFLTVRNGRMTPLLEGPQTEALLRDAARFYREQTGVGMPDSTRPALPTPVSPTERD